MRHLTTLAALAALGLAAPAMAHDTGIPHSHPHQSETTGATASKPGPNGGQVAIAGHHPIEMVAGEKELVFYVLDEDGKPSDTKGVTGRASVTQGGKTTTVQLAAAAPNKLTGILAAPLGAGAKVVFSAKFHGHAAQARFEVK